VYTDWMDFDGRLPVPEIEARVAAEADVVAHLVRSDLFDRYPDGHSVRRVYVRRAAAPPPQGSPRGAS
jgi:hypothetical protein